jgi:hypothetical protein
MRKRRKERTSYKKIGVVLAVLIPLTIIIVVGLYQLPTQSQTVKKQAREYFEILEPTVDNGEFLNPTVDQGGSYQNSSRLRIYGISFTLKAIGGDAHSIVVRSWAQADLFAIEGLAKGEEKYVSQISAYPYGMIVEKNSEGVFQWTAKITSEEAEGEITFDLPP